MSALIFKHECPQQETADSELLLLTPIKKDLLYMQGLWYRSKMLNLAVHILLLHTVYVFLFSNLLLNQTFKCFI